jgi:glyoxalase family protein
MNSKILGIHHVTAISGPAQENFKFYTETLGLRLVKRTVNFDDPGVYHLYYGDQTGSPGTLMTFFPYGGPQGDKGTGQVVASSYPVRDLEMWKKRLNVPFQIETRFGVEYVAFEDPHGMALELYQSDSAPDKLGPIGGATLKLRSLEKTAPLLKLLGFEEKARENSRLKFTLPGSEETLDILLSNEAPTRGGAGTVHHIALRVADDKAQQFWREKLIKSGYRVSPVMDRNYFHSIYLRGPGGVLFELATDPPGMLIDESIEELGTRLLLPAQYEPHRDRIEAALEPLEEPYKDTIERFTPNL